jgi:magnesium transporter
MIPLEFQEVYKEMDRLYDYLDRDRSDTLHPAEIANFLKDLDDTSFNEALTLIPKELIGEVALELPDRYFGDVVDSFSVEELAVGVSELESDDQTDFMQELEEVSEEIAKEVFKQLDRQDQKDILQLKQYADSQAGAYMQTEIYTAHLLESVHDVIRNFATLRKEGGLENVQYLFVLDDKRILRYCIGLDTLLTFNFAKSLKENMTKSEDRFKPIVAQDDESIDEVVKKFQEYNLGALPIINEEGVILGRITSDDIYDIIDEQATDQMYHLAGVNDEAEEHESIFHAGKSRSLWLMLNLLTAIAASLVIGLFEQTLQNLVALAILMPIVASMGGNAGTQSLTVVVRQLALGDIAKHDAFRTIKKEVLIALANGLIFAIIVGIIASVWFDQGMLGVVIAISMVINLLSAGFFGSVVPLLLQKMEIDPAVGSTVILTTVTDVVGFFSFLGLATIILL